eukprot:Ihof_evm3s364 gene=Ihof_evmTU3s364
MSLHYGEFQSLPLDESQLLYQGQGNVQKELWQDLPYDPYLKQLSSGSLDSTALPSQIHTNEPLPLPLTHPQPSPGVSSQRPYGSTNSSLPLLNDPALSTRQGPVREPNNPASTLVDYLPYTPSSAPPGSSDTSGYRLETIPPLGRMVSSPTLISLGEEDGVESGEGLNRMSVHYPIGGKAYPLKSPIGLQATVAPQRYSQQPPFSLQTSTPLGCYDYTRLVLAKRYSYTSQSILEQLYSRLAHSILIKNMILREVSMDLGNNLPLLQGNGPTKVNQYLPTIPAGLEPYTAPRILYPPHPSHGSQYLSSQPSHDTQSSPQTNIAPRVDPVLAQGMLQQGTLPSGYSSSLPVICSPRPLKAISTSGLQWQENSISPAQGHFIVSQPSGDHKGHQPLMAQQRTSMGHISRENNDIPAPIQADLSTWNPQSLMWNLVGSKPLANDLVPPKASGLSQMLPASQTPASMEGWPMLALSRKEDVGLPQTANRNGMPPSGDMPVQVDLTPPTNGWVAGYGDSKQQDIKNNQDDLGTLLPNPLQQPQRAPRGPVQIPQEQQTKQKEKQQLPSTEPWAADVVHESSRDNRREDPQYYSPRKWDVRKPDQASTPGENPWASELAKKKAFHWNDRMPQTTANHIYHDYRKGSGSKFSATSTWADLLEASQTKSSTAGSDGTGSQGWLYNGQDRLEQEAKARKGDNAGIAEGHLPLYPAPSSSQQHPSSHTVRTLLPVQPIPQSSDQPKAPQLFQKGPLDQTRNSGKLEKTADDGYQVSLEPQGITHTQAQLQATWAKKAGPEMDQEECPTPNTRGEAVTLQPQEQRPLPMNLSLGMQLNTSIPDTFHKGLSRLSNLAGHGSSGETNYAPVYPARQNRGPHRQPYTPFMLYQREVSGVIIQQYPGLTAKPFQKAYERNMRTWKKSMTDYEKAQGGRGPKADATQQHGFQLQAVIEDDAYPHVPRSIHQQKLWPNVDIGQQEDKEKAVQPDQAQIERKGSMKGVLSLNKALVKIWPKGHKDMLQKMKHTEQLQEEERQKSGEQQGQLKTQVQQKDLQEAEREQAVYRKLDRAYREYENPRGHTADINVQGPQTGLSAQDLQGHIAHDSAMMDMDLPITTHKIHSSERLPSQKPYISQSELSTHCLPSTKTVDVAVDTNDLPVNSENQRIGPESIFTSSFTAYNMERDFILDQLREEVRLSGLQHNTLTVQVANLRKLTQMLRNTAQLSKSDDGDLYDAMVGEFQAEVCEAFSGLHFPNLPASVDLSSETRHALSYGPRRDNIEHYVLGLIQVVQGTGMDWAMLRTLKK